MNIEMIEDYKKTASHNLLIWAHLKDAFCDQNWSRACEATYEICDCYERLLIDARARVTHEECKSGGRPGWIKSVQYAFAKKYNWHPSGTTLKNMWRDLTMRLALVFLLIKCSEKRQCP